MAVLTVNERQLFSLVRQANSTNPFTNLREELDLKIAEVGQGHWQAHHVDQAAQRVRRIVERLVEEKRGNIALYKGSDRNRVESAFLFDIFHRYLDRFDMLIVDQIKAEDRSLPVPFAAEAIGLLEQRGFSHSNALRYFELFFQLRRAFYFIQRNLVGRSPCMRKLRASLWNNVFTHNIDWYDRFLWNRMEDFSTLILGPTGAGKGTAALAIGRSGYIPFDEKNERFAESFMSIFVPLNLSQYSPTLIESELFGHKKGAFTGATEDYKGVFDRCSMYGAIFLDEIGEIGESIQIKLLQILQERKFYPVGGHKPGRFAGRVIAATNRPLKELRDKRVLRDDFFYRLCSDVIVLPSLAQRIGEDSRELDDLLAHTVNRILGAPSPEMTTMLIKTIAKQPGADYMWPGNVRELEQCVRRIMLNDTYKPDHEIGALTGSARLAEEMLIGLLNAQALLEGYCYFLYQQKGSYEAVARITDLDRRTVKKHILAGKRRLHGD
jgi:DNA-binding NtrC family response regulator